MNVKKKQSKWPLRLYLENRWKNNSGNKGLKKIMFVIEMKTKYPPKASFHKNAFFKI